MHAVCDQGFFCEFCVTDFYPDRAYENGHCRCDQCHPKYLQYEWFHEVISAHYDTYYCKEKNDFGEWMFQLIRVVLEKLNMEDDGILIEAPKDPFENLRIKLQQVTPQKTKSKASRNKTAVMLPDSVTTVAKLRKLQDTESCHLCRKKESDCAGDRFWCDSPNCGLVYCWTRLNKYHHEHYEGIDLNQELFICPRCTGICICSKCNMKRAYETMCESTKTKRQWMIYYLHNIHIFGGDRALYEVLRSIMPSTNLIAKIADNLVLMYAPPVSSVPLAPLALSTLST